ncbi:MAG: hypothetical protein HY547_07225 [Elusimicrobia bacterium]|nr:hypothetical protein [Elusimicrobiota bacterium]
MKRGAPANHHLPKDSPKHSPLEEFKSFGGEVEFLEYLKNTPPMRFIREDGFYREKYLQRKRMVEIEHAFQRLTSLLEKEKKALPDLPGAKEWSRLIIDGWLPRLKEMDHYVAKIRSRCDLPSRGSSVANYDRYYLMAALIPYIAMKNKKSGKPSWKLITRLLNYFAGYDDRDEKTSSYHIRHSKEWWNNVIKCQKNPLPHSLQMLMAEGVLAYLKMKGTKSLSAKKQTKYNELINQFAFSPYSQLPTAFVPTTINILKFWIKQSRTLLGNNAFSDQKDSERYWSAELKFMPMMTATDFFETTKPPSKPSRSRYARLKRRSFQKNVKTKPPSSSSLPTKRLPKSSSRR